MKGVGIMSDRNIVNALEAAEDAMKAIAQMSRSDIIRQFDMPETEVNPLVWLLDTYTMAELIHKSREGQGFRAGDEVETVVGAKSIVIYVDRGGVFALNRANLMPGWISASIIHKTGKHFESVEKMLKEIKA